MKNLKNKRFYILSIVIYFVLFIFTVAFSYIKIEQFATSTLIYLTAPKSYSKDVVEVLIDDYSAQKYKWNKNSISDLLDYFHKYTKSNLIGFDYNPTSFVDNDVDKSDLKFIAQLDKMYNLVFGFIPEHVANGEDDQMLEEFKKDYALDVDYKTYTRPYYNNGVKSGSRALRKATHNNGSVVFSPSESGYTFDVLNVIQIKDGFYPSLALKMYLLKNNTNKIVIDNDYIIIPKTGLKLNYMCYAGEFSNYIRFYRQNSRGLSYKSYHASDILQSYYDINSGKKPKIDPKLFDNKAIFIGNIESGHSISTDVLKTPMSDRHPGVDIHATIYDNMVNNITITPVGPLISLLLYLFLCLCAFLIILKKNFLQGLSFLILFDVLYLVLVYVLMLNGYLVHYVTPLICQFVTAIFAYSFKFLNENRNKEMIKNAMGKYLSQDIMKNVVKNIDDLKLGGKRAVVTVLFSDIRGFTSMSEKMSAEEVSSILNEYFAQMEPIITKYNGVINKFIGDAIMAIFGEPIQDENHPQNAVKCAYEMLNKVNYLKEKWILEGKPKFEIGVGINTGEVFIGNIGTETRMEYTVIGDTVNLASRIEGYNKVYKTNLLVSSSTYSYIADIADVIKIKEVQIRGKSKKMDIYEILRIEK